MTNHIRDILFSMTDRRVRFDLLIRFHNRHGHGHGLGHRHRPHLLRIHLVQCVSTDGTDIIVVMHNRDLRVFDISTGLDGRPVMGGLTDTTMSSIQATGPALAPTSVVERL